MITAVQLLNKTIRGSGVDPLVLELVHLRASQINGCSPCLYAGVASAKKQGETDERLHSVAAWRETPFFSEPERAALALAEAATRVQDGAPGVTDEIWAQAAGHVDERQLSGIVLNIAITNFLNRINPAVREQAGTIWRAGAAVAPLLAAVVVPAVPRGRVDADRRSVNVTLTEEGVAEELRDQLNRIAVDDRLLPHR